MSITLILLILSLFVLNFLGALAVKEFYHEVFDLNFVLNKWFKVLLLLTPLGIIGLASIILILIIAIIIMPFEKYFKNSEDSNTPEPNRTCKPNKPKQQLSKRTFINNLKK